MTYIGRKHGQQATYSDHSIVTKDALMSEFTKVVGTWFGRMRPKQVKDDETWDLYLKLTAAFPAWREGTVTTINDAQERNAWPMGWPDLNT